VARGFGRLSDAQADAAVAESGVPLGADQAAALRGVLTSGAGVESLIAAAGTGKSFVVSAIADAWQHSPATPGGTNDPSEGEPSPGGRVFGLAPYQNARRRPGRRRAGDEECRGLAATQALLDRPRRAGCRRRGLAARRRDLVVLDEAGTAATGDLLAMQQRFPTRRRWSSDATQSRPTHSRLINENEVSRDRLLATGQQVAVRGRLVGTYLFTLRINSAAATTSH
jgi:hypothetical protein